MKHTDIPYCHGSGCILSSCVSGSLNHDKGRPSLYRTNHSPAKNSVNLSNHRVENSNNVNLTNHRAENTAAHCDRTSAEISKQSWIPTSKRSGVITDPDFQKNRRGICGTLWIVFFYKRPGVQLSPKRLIKRSRDRKSSDPLQTL